MSRRSKPARQALSFEWIIRTKLLAPKSQDWEIPRLDALRKLDDALGTRLRVVLAPPGYGKSTLLAQWIESPRCTAAKLGWLSLDEGDTEPTTFLSYLLAALEDDYLAEDLLEKKFPQSLGAPLLDRVLAHIASKTSASTDEVLLVLDDYHRADSEAVNKIVLRLLDAMPANFHMVIATREKPRLAISGLTAQGQAVSLVADDLSFSIEEARAFIAERLQSPLSASESEMLWQRTEGWPLAIQTACLWLESNNANLNSIDQFSGRVTEISDYLNEQIVNELPAGVQSFLLNTSILEQFNGDLANAVCQRDDCWETVESMRRRNLFLIPQDYEGNWYRYHQLLRDFLLERFKRKDPEELMRCRIRAAEWLAEQDLLRNALHQYLLAGKPESAANLIEQRGGWRLVFSGRISDLRYLFHHLSDDITRQFPRLLLGQIYLHAKSGQNKLAMHLLELWDRAEFLTRQNADILRWERLIIERIVTSYTAEPAQIDELDALWSRIKRAQPAGDTVFVLALLYNDLCAHYFDLCAFDKAAESAESSIQFYRASGNHYTAYFLHLFLGQISLFTGKPGEALRIYRRTRRNAQQDFGEDSDVVFLSRVLLAETLFEKNDLPRAIKELQASIRHTEQFDGWFDIYAAAYTTESYLAFQSTGIGDALAIWDRAENIAERRSIDNLATLAGYHRVSLLTLDGQLDAAGELASRLGPETREGEVIKLRHARGVALARLYIATGEYDRAKIILAPLLSESTALGWVRQSLKLLVLESLNCLQQHDRQNGYAILNQALVSASVGEYYRAFLDEGRLLGEHLRAALSEKDALAPAATRFARRILSARLGGPDSGASGAPAALPDVTPRELETLKLLGDGLSNKQMAHRLGISESTVKFHKKNLYRKLGVNDRARALAVARERYLL